MTNEEAITRIKALLVLSSQNDLKNTGEALRMAIDALENSIAPMNISQWEQKCDKCKYEDDDDGITIYYPSDWDNGIGFEYGNAIFCPKCGRPLTKEAWEKLEKRIGGNV